MIARNLQPAIDLIKEFEGLKDGDPTSIRLDPYLCPAGYWTKIGGNESVGLKRRRNAEAMLWGETP